MVVLCRRPLLPRVPPLKTLLRLVEDGTATLHFETLPPKFQSFLGGTFCEIASIFDSVAAGRERGLFGPHSTTTPWLSSSERHMRFHQYPGACKTLGFLQVTVLEPDDLENGPNFAPDGAQRTVDLRDLG